MEAKTFAMDNGECVEVDVKQCERSGSVMVQQHFKAADGATKGVTVTVTCTDGDGKQYSTSKQCPTSQSNTGDCSDPKNPKITCG